MSSPLLLIFWTLSFSSHSNSDFLPPSFQGLRKALLSIAVIVIGWSKELIKLDVGRVYGFTYLEAN